MGQIDATALGLCITFPILAILTVAARFYCRHLQKLGYYLDDWVVLAALIPSIGNAVNVLYGAIQANLGQHAPLDPQGLALLGPKVVILEKMAYIAEIIVTVAIGLARWSILLLYSRLFSVRLFKIPVWVMYVLNGIWTVAFTLAYIFQCVPPSLLWTEPEGGRTGCIDLSVNLYYAVSSTILDILVLCMPWPMVWRLHMPLARKIAVLGILMLGAIIVAVSIGKCYTFFTIGTLLETNHDVTYDEGPLFYWVVPESCLSVVCASLPTLRPLFHGKSPESVLNSFRSVFSLRSLRSTGSGDANNTNGSRSYGLRSSQDGMNALRGGSKHSRSSNEGDSLSQGAGAHAYVSHPGNEYKMNDLERGPGSITVQQSFSTTHETYNGRGRPT